jgi:FKBP-type peptidyl-prolyl cis-trans isomerase SlyD
MADAADPGTYKIEETKSYVRIGYRVRKVDGPMLKGASEPENMDFVTGFLQVIPGLETRLIGRSAGEKLSMTIPPEEAFGPRHEELVVEKPVSEFHFPGDYYPYVGMEIPLISGVDNAPETAVIKEVRGDTIVMDVNHPLAGVALQYEVEILEARPAESTDMCSEWESTTAEDACCSTAPTLVLGQDGPEEN